MNRTTRLYGVINVAYGLTLAVILLEVLVARHLLVDVMGGATALLLLSSGLGLLIRLPWALRLSQVAAGVLLCFGVVLLGAILLSIGFLHGIYGAVGQGGTAVLFALLGLLVPYFIVLPVVELVTLGRALRARTAGEASTP